MENTQTKRKIHKSQDEQLGDSLCPSLHGRILRFNKCVHLNRDFKQDPALSLLCNPVNHLSPINNLLGFGFPLSWVSAEEEINGKDWIASSGKLWARANLSEEVE